MLITLSFILSTTLIGFGKSDWQTQKQSSSKILYILNFADGSTKITFNNYVERKAWKSYHLLRESQYFPTIEKLNVAAVMVVNLKSNYKVFTLNDVLSEYNVPEKHSSAQIKIDDDILAFPESILISLSQIKSVKLIRTEKEYYINIITIGYKFKKETEEAYKKGETTGYIKNRKQAL